MAFLLLLAAVLAAEIEGVVPFLVLLKSQHNAHLLLLL